MVKKVETYQIAFKKDSDMMDVFKSRLEEEGILLEFDNGNKSGTLYSRSNGHKFFIGEYFQSHGRSSYVIINPNRIVLKEDIAKKHISKLTKILEEEFTAYPD